MKKITALSLSIPVVLAVAVGASSLRGAGRDASETAGAAQFDAQKAFCEQQTFLPEEAAQVSGWYYYVAGLRTGRSAPPDQQCPGTTARALLSAFSADDKKTARSMVAAIWRSYMAAAMTPDSVARAYDADGSYRYRVDATALSFIWLQCLGEKSTGPAACLLDVAAALPEQYTASSPVFCDFAPDPVSINQIEFPAHLTATIGAELPALCGPLAGQGPAESVKAARLNWVERVTADLGK